MWRTERRGFSLPELIVSAFVFLLVFGVGILAVSSGFHLYTEASVRQSLQREMAAISAFLREDGSKTNFARTRVARRVAADDRSRDALILVGLRSWGGSLPLDEQGLPAWNSVVVYQATQEERGRLLRSLIHPQSTPILEAHLLPLLGAALAGALDAGDVLHGEKLLSRSVGEFKLEPEPGLGLLRCDLTLEEQRAEAGRLNSRKEVLDVSILIYPQNTWPRIN